MSYMSQAAFAPTGGIQELSFGEINAVDGGIVPILFFSAGLIVGFGLAAGADYLNGGFND